MTSETHVLVFARTWSMDSMDKATVQAILERVRSLGVEVVVLCRSGVWSVRPDDTTIGRTTDKLVGDVATAATLYAARGNNDAVYVIDGGSVVRVGAGKSLLEALDDAAEVMVRRQLRSAVVAANDSNQVPPSTFAWCTEHSLVALRS